MLKQYHLTGKDASFTRSYGFESCYCANLFNCGGIGIRWGLTSPRQMKTNLAVLLNNMWR